MIETTVRHPRLVAALAGLVAVVAAVALIGPRNSSVVGVGDASATDATDQTTSSTTHPGDDGVVLTAPGELVTVIEGPTPTSDGGVGIAGTPPASTVAPSASTTSVTAGENDGTPSVSETTVPNTEVLDTGVPTTGVPDAGVPDAGQVEPSTPPTTEPLGENAAAVVDGAQATFGDRLLAAPELTGAARGSMIEPEPLIGQVGTRDANSVPWMLLIAANFGIAVFALAMLRLRR